MNPFFSLLTFLSGSLSNPSDVLVLAPPKNPGKKMARVVASVDVVVVEVLALVVAGVVLVVASVVP